MSTPTTQGQTESPAQRVIDHIVAERFTGLLRVRAREADGELWFLAGIQEDARFGMSRGEDALQRILKVTEASFEAEQRLPSLTGGFKTRVPEKGSFADAQPVVLMRYCEEFALTCTLELIGKVHQVRITYRTGELLTIDSGAGGNDALPALLESTEGTYQFELPPFELPAGVSRPRRSSFPGAITTGAASPAPAAAKTSLADRVDRSLSSGGSAPPVAAAPAASDVAEQKRQADAREAETRRKAEAEREAETRRQADAEARRQAEARREAEARAQREAEDRRRADAKREAEAQAERDAEQRRRDEKQREAEVREMRDAEERRAAAEREEEEQRRAEVEREEEAQREAETTKKAAETDEDRAGMPREVVVQREPRAARPGAEKRKAPADDHRRSRSVVPEAQAATVWLWLLFVVVAVCVAYFFLGKYRVTLRLHP
jgi:hypothetical protein